MLNLYPVPFESLYQAEELKERITCLQEKLKNHESCSRKVQNILQKRIQELETERDEARKARDEFSRWHREALNERDKAKRDCENYKELYLLLSRRYVALGKEQFHEYDRLSQECDELNMELEQAKKEYEVCLNFKITYKRQKDELQAQVKSLKEANRHCAQEVYEQENIITDLRRDVKELSEKITKLQRTRVGKVIDEQEKEIAELKAERTTWKNFSELNHNARQKLTEAVEDVLDMHMVYAQDAIEKYGIKGKRE